MNNMNVMNRRMFQMPSAPRPMQQGGMATMMPPEMMGPPPMAPEPAMMPPPAPAPAPGPQDISDEGVATLLAEQGIDPAQMQGLLESAAVGFGNLDEVTDYEQAINAIRGDQASLGQRRDELAELVGSQDANKTPESVLTLVQPVMMLAEIDQGIGGLAQGAMTEPVTGDMAGGIMSTVGMGGAEEAPAPVNFNQGGAVQRFAPENPRVAGDPNRIRNLFTEQQQLYGDLITPTLTAEDLAEDRRLTEAQMLFDIAQAGLQLAQPGRPGENFLGSVARAASDSQVFDKIGARAAEQRKLERAARAEKQAIDLAALKSAEDIYSTERAFDAAIAKLTSGFGQESIGKLYDVLDASGSVVRERVPLTNADFAKITETGGSVIPYSAERFGSAAETNQLKVMQKLLPSYADGTISDEDELTLEFILTKEYGPTVDIEGRESYPSMPVGVKSALQSRLDKGLSTPSKLTLGMEPEPVDVTDPVDVTEAAIVSQMSEEEKQIAEEIPVDSPQFIDELLNEERNQPDYDSPHWFRLKGQRFDPEIGSTYEKSFGIGSINTRIGNWFAKNLREVGVGTGVSEEGKKVIEGDADWASFRVDLTQFETQQGGLGGDERVLKSVQELINEELDALRPSLLGNSDENAVAALSNVKKKLGTYWANEIKKLKGLQNQYRGNPLAYTKTQVAEARDRIEKVQLMLVDAILFEKVIRDHLATSQTGVKLQGKGVGANEIRQAILDKRL